MNNLRIEMWPVEKLIPYPNAIRKNDHAVRRMISLIEEFGFKLPLLIRGGGEIVDGHLRWKAAKKLKLAEVPVIHCDEWSEAQVKAFRLAVNRNPAFGAEAESLCPIDDRLSAGLYPDLVEPSIARFGKSLDEIDETTIAFLPIVKGQVTDLD